MSRSVAPHFRPFVLSKLGQPAKTKLPGPDLPFQRSIRKLSDDLKALNERIAELEREGHRGDAIAVLKVNAVDFARKLDELRSLLIVVPVKKGR